jgi:6-phosphogluconolactonase
MTEIIKASTPELEKLAADLIKDSILDLLKEKNQVVLALPGGRSVPGIFRGLKRAPGIPWEKVLIFMIDERLVVLDHRDSNFRLLKENLVDDLIETGKIPQENVHPFIFDEKAADLGINKYEEELLGAGGIYDIVLLSAGEDGHVGGLFPRHPSIEDKADFFVVMHDAPKPPVDRMSASRQLIQKAKVSIILFFGKGKREALNNFFDDKFDYKACPAKLVQSIERSYLLTDLY